ncbi:hypothetical protein HNV12_01540 [Methanococcoides sp. SA1]|nr:hypothetical protein [Methanococcoides sp. SA1]
MESSAKFKISQNEGFSVTIVLAVITAAFIICFPNGAKAEEVHHPLVTPDVFMNEAAGWKGKVILEWGNRQSMEFTTNKLNLAISKVEASFWKTGSDPILEAWGYIYKDEVFSFEENPEGSNIWVQTGKHQGYTQPPPKN